MPTAVLLLAYGGPDSLADVPAYLQKIRGGRPTPEHLVEEVTERYRLIGGRSPLLEITRRVVAKLQERLGLPVYTGMRHWKPFIGDTVDQMVQDGVDEVVAICLAPHYSRLSIGQYRQALDEAIAATGREVRVHFVDQWHTEPNYLQGLAYNVRQALSRWPAAEREKVKVIFTAHSLPSFILEQGDPYDGQLRETATLLAQKLALPARRWTFCYQSAAQTGVPWLGPPVEELVTVLAQAGQRDLLVAPIGFLADHVEVLYDIDMVVQNIARKYGARLERAPMLNDGDALVRALTVLASAALNPVWA